MASRTPDILYQGQPGTSNTDLYTVPASTKVTITGIIITNTNSATKYITLHIVQNGDSVANDVALLYQQDINGTGDSEGAGVLVFDTPIPLNTVGDKISGIQETAGAITVTIIGFTEAT